MRALSGPRSVLRYARQPLRRFEAARALSDRAVAFRVFGVYYILLFDPAMIEPHAARPFQSRARFALAPDGSRDAQAESR